MKAEFEYSEEEIRVIVLHCHEEMWRNFSPLTHVWVATTDYRGVIVRLEEKPKEEADDRP